MQKLRHKIAIFALIMCFGFINPISICKAEIPVVQDVEQSALRQEDANIADLDIEPINTEQVKKNVVPDTKSELKKVINLFLKTMASVAVCAVILYIVLIFVKKYYGSAFVPPVDDEEYDNLELTTPEDKTSALKSFLNRTK